jgi:hypothetical protein
MFTNGIFTLFHARAAEYQFSVVCVAHSTDVQAIPMLATERMVHCIRADDEARLLLCRRDFFSSSIEVDARCFVIRNFVQM